jgi:hypothetical protein
LKIISVNHCIFKIPQLISDSSFPLIIFDFPVGLGAQLDGVAKTAMAEVGDVQLGGHFAEIRFSKQPFFRNGMSRTSSVNRNNMSFNIVGFPCVTMETLDSLFFQVIT